MGMGTSAPNWHRAFLGAALLCRQPWLGECCPILCAVPQGMLGLVGLFWQARLFGAGGSAQQRTSSFWIPSSGAGQPFSLLSCPFSAGHARPCSAALQAEAAVIFQHVLHRGVVGPTRQLRSLFRVFTCLGKAHPCFVGSLLGCTNSVRQNHEQVLVQPG